MKDTVKRIRRQATDWEKMFAKDKSDKGLLSKIYKKILKTIIIIKDFFHLFLLVGG